MNKEREEIISDLKVWRNLARYGAKYARNKWNGDILNGDYWLSVAEHHGQAGHFLDKVIRHLESE